MPRKSINYKDLRKSNVVDEVANEPPPPIGFKRKNRRRGDSGEELSGRDEEPEFFNICPCNDCAKKNKPTVRSSSTIERHIDKWGLSSRYKVKYLSITSVLERLFFGPCNSWNRRQCIPMNILMLYKSHYNNMGHIPHTCDPNMNSVLVFVLNII